MHIMRSRRDFLLGASVAGLAGVVGSGNPLAGEPPPEVTTLRLRRDSPGPGYVCYAPEYLAEELLRAEGFTDIRYIFVPPGVQTAQAFEAGDLDFGQVIAMIAAMRLEAGAPYTILAGVHTGCFELFVHRSIQTITDLKGKRVGIWLPGAPDHLFVSIMAAYVGLDPQRDIHWVTTDNRTRTMELFVLGEVDAVLASVPEPQELRARKMGHVILNTAIDKPWSEYFCCLLGGSRDFVQSYPVATRRVLRAILKATDLCGTQPEWAARRLVEGGFTDSLPHARQALTEIPYASWREFDPEDSMRFFALRLHEIGMLTSSPNEILAKGTDWRFLNELKRELKA